MPIKEPPATWSNKPFNPEEVHLDLERIAGIKLDKPVNELELQIEKLKKENKRLKAQLLKSKTKSFIVPDIFMLMLISLSSTIQRHAASKYKPVWKQFMLWVINEGYKK